MHWVTAKDLEEWAVRHDSKAYTPHLIRRLIEATAQTLHGLEFPVAESIARSGFDGVANAISNDKDREFLPNGISVWEVSADSNVRDKAVDDFNLRSEGPLPETLPGNALRLDAAYVAVTVRAWPKPRKKRAAKKTDNAAKPKPSEILDAESIGSLEDFIVKAKETSLWRDVLVLDALKLERWIEQRPAVGVWAARYLLQKHNGLIRDLEGEWDFQRLQSDPVRWSTSLLLAGRSAEGEEVLKKLLEPASVTSILADSVDEGIAFAIATVLSLPEEHPHRGRIASSTLVLGDETEANNLLNDKPLVLILRDHAVHAARVLAAKGHTCVVSIGQSQVKSGGAVVKLPRSPRNLFIQALLKDGFSLDDAAKHARLCNGSLTVLRRRVGHPALPHWAQQQQSLVDLAPIALLGMFDTNWEGDLECLSDLATMSHEAYLDILLKHRGPGVDPPIVMIESQWSVYAPADILTVAFEQQIIGKNLLERFAAVATKVLSEPDGALRLPLEERPMASIRGIKRRYSGQLRNGISESLRLLAANPDVLHRELGGSGQAWIEALVAKCPGISDDPYALLSMGNMLPAVAEAAPSTFLDALEALLRGHRDTMQGILFADSDDFFSSGSLFVQFTNALEIVAWDAEKTNRVLDQLVTLSEMDPGGRISNRPVASLAHYFLPWAPATNAPIALRSEQLSRILDRANSRVAWELIKRLLPGATSSVSGFSTPHWRIFESNDSVTYDELYAAFSDTAEHGVRLAGTDIVRWRALVAALTNSGPAQLNAILTALEHLDVSANAQDSFWELLRQEVARNERFNETPWALKGDVLDRLRTISARFSPADLSSKNRWLFDSGWPDVELIAADDDDDEKARLRLRTAAVKEILDNGGHPAVLKFASAVKMSQILVEPLITLLSADDVERLTMEALQTLNDSSLAAGLSAAGQAKFGREWTRGLLTSARALEPAKQAALIQNWTDRDAIEAAQAMGELVEKAYWALRPAWIRDADPDVRQQVIRGMVGAGRGVEIAPYVSAHRKNMPTALLLDVVNAAYAALSANPNASNVANLSYHLTEIIRTLGEREDVAEGEVAQLEFVFLKHLLGHGRTTEKLILHRLMATDPQHFFDAIKAVFRGDEEPPSQGPPSDRERVHAAQCYRLLESFSFGKNTWAESLLLNQPGKLGDWVDQVRTLAAATGRTTITNSQIGRLFASTGDDPTDGLRPHRAVRDVIEKIHNEEMLRGFTSEVFNLRGVHSRGLDEGGEQEHKLADGWQSIANKLGQWPHTARFARDVSAMWRANAEQEDSRREKRHARGE